MLRVTIFLRLTEKKIYHPFLRCYTKRRITIFTLSRFFFQKETFHHRRARECVSTCCVSSVSLYASHTHYDGSALLILMIAASGKESILSTIFTSCFMQLLMLCNCYFSYILSVYVASLGCESKHTRFPLTVNRCIIACRPKEIDHNTAGPVFGPFRVIADGERPANPDFNVPGTREITWRASFFVAAQCGHVSSSRVQVYTLMRTYVPLTCKGAAVASAACRTHVMSHRKRESLPLRNAGHAAPGRACTRKLRGPAKR